MLLHSSFFSPFANIDPERLINTMMFVQLLQNSLSEYSASAKIAGLEWGINYEKGGMKVSQRCY